MNPAPPFPSRIRGRFPSVRSSFTGNRPKKLKKALQKAEKTNASFVFVIGEDEAANGKILMKNMATREQKIFDKNDIRGIIKEISEAEKALPAD